MLKAMAQVIEGSCRNSDYVCRWGGDEFCVPLPETDEYGACIWADPCCSVLAETTFRAGSHGLPLNASFGVAQRHADMQGPEQLLRLADQEVLWAKRAGRRRAVTAWGGCLGQPCGTADCISEPCTTADSIMMAGSPLTHFCTADVTDKDLS